MHGSTDSIDLEGIQNGEAPESRLTDPNKAFDMVDALIRANSKRADVDSRVKGQLDGNPPYDPTMLKKNAQANRTNINFREAEGIHNAAVSPFYDLFAQAPYFCEVQTDVGQEADRVAWSKIITKHHDRMLKEWDKFDFSMQLMISNRTDFGKGFLMWPDNETWRAEVVLHSKVLVPDGTNASIDEDLDVIVIREQFPLVKLWGAIRNAQAATSAGWNREAVLREMYAATPEGRTKLQDSDFYEWYQQQLRNNDVSESVRASKVAAAHILVREYDGKITHLIISEKATPQVNPNDTTGKAKKRDFLFRRLGQFESFRQALAGFFYDIGDGTWHSVKGLLVKLFPFVALKDRLNCAVADNAFTNMSLLVKATTKAALNDLQLLRVGSMTIIPPDLNLEQHQLIGRMEESLVLERHLDNKLQTNIGQYKTNAKREKGNPITATQAAADEAKEASLSQSAVNRFYGELDFFYEEVYRRASNPNLRRGNSANNAALDFQKRCLAEGVPPEALVNIRSVRAYRNVGNGSVFMRQAAFQNGLAIVPMFNEEGRNNFLSDAIATLFSQDMVSRYNPQPKDMYSVQEQTSYAMVENGAIHDGINPMVAATQNHVVHADVHLKMASDAAKSLMEGQGNPMEVYSLLEITGPHVLAHLRQFANDPTRARQYKALEATWKQVSTFTDQLRTRIETAIKQQAAQQAEAGQQQSAEAAEEARKDAKLQAEIARKDEKAEVDKQVKQDKANQALELNARKAQQGEAIADIQTANDIARKAEQDAAAAAEAKKKK
jgi:hypothetical protein